MRRILDALIVAAVMLLGIACIPLAHADPPSPGSLCYSWHATTTDSNGNTLVCTHTPDSGHLMYWEGQVMDR
jgi:hypothetical protein